MVEKLNKNAKVEQLTKVVLSNGEEKALSLKILYLSEKGCLLLHCPIDINHGLHFIDPQR